MKNIICKNCNKYGHYVYNCRYPIISYGIIAYKYNNLKKLYEFLMIRRKHTHGFNEFIRGKYSVNNNILIDKFNNRNDKKRARINHMW